jgi:hypothetical protein
MGFPPGTQPHEFGSNGLHFCLVCFFQKKVRHKSPTAPYIKPFRITVNAIRNACTERLACSVAISKIEDGQKDRTKIGSISCVLGEWLIR